METGAGRRIGELLLGTGSASDVALRSGDRDLTYGELRAAVARRAAEIAGSTPPERSIVLLAGPPSMAWITSYLAILEAGHVPLLAGDRHDALEARWVPALVIEAQPDLVVDRAGPPGTVRPALHPDLGLLLSTSGSTGSPKLVRLSHDNLVANATSIAASLGLTRADVGVTALPLHYCYGLSVLHSHLAVGAAVSVVRASVVDPCFLDALERHGVTSLAGVPHTFDLLEVAGPERIATPALRLITQAGGVLDPGARDRWRARTAAWGVDFVVMYGQTEATARMAYLPPERAAQAGARSVGIPVPGGSFDVVPVAGADELGDDGVGELVYHGPNVMMGYGVEPADLALGPSLDALRTGDLGRFDPASGTYEVVGRQSRFTKPFGLRIDLDGVEAALRLGRQEAAVGGDDQVLVAVVPGADAAAVEADLVDLTGLPAAAIAVVVDHPIPRTPSGKVDQAAVRSLATASAVGDSDERVASDVIAHVLGVAGLDPLDTFTSAGGDSLSYVEASLRLERLVGRLPDDWQHATMAELDALTPGPASRRVDTTVVLRAVGICTVVATHMDIVFFPGGAHLLLAVAGYNLSRFHLGIVRTRDRVRASLRTVARVAIPTVAVALAVLALTNRYGWTTAALVNNYLGPRHHGLGHWHFWFIEAFVQISLVVAAVLAIPAVRRAERARPYAFVLAALGAALILREVTWWGIDDPFNLRFRTHSVAFFFVLGWLIHRSTTTATRVLTSVVCAASVIGFFGQPVREAFILSGILLLLWARRVPLPKAVLPVAAALASASMWILISHFHLWPPIEDRTPLAVAYVLTLAAGVGVWLAVERGPKLVRHAVRRSAEPRPAALAPVPLGRTPEALATDA